MQLKSIQKHPLVRELRRSPIGMFSAVVFVIYLFVALFGSQLAPYSETAMQTLPRQAPSTQHWFGTDELGRDILSRILGGARAAFLVAFVSIGIGLVIGGVMGFAAGFYGQWLDSVLMRFVDVLLAFPGLLLALAIITFLGPSLTNTIIAIGIGSIPGYARLMRSEVLGILERDFVSAAKALGARELRIMVRHILPLTISSLVIFSTAQLARAILAEAGLSFLGLGIQPPFPSWGGMIASGQRYFLSAPFMVIIPGVTVMILVFALNLLGDTLRDALNPQLRNRD